MFVLECVDVFVSVYLREKESERQTEGNTYDRCRLLALKGHC